jgi:uncharacterized protein (TIGR03086 family)
MDLMSAHRKSVEDWLARVSAVGDEQWDKPTPCSEWNVRVLVNHVVGEDRWTVPLVEGKTIGEVGSDLDGDLLGDDPISAARAAGDAAIAIVGEKLPVGGKVHLSYGDEDLDEYIRQLLADHVIHAWDLAAATGGDESLDPELVAEVAAWFADREGMYRSGGAVGPRPETTSTDPQAVLLAASGRNSDWASGATSA